jgi:hypothetical protein
MYVTHVDFPDFSFLPLFTRLLYPNSCLPPFPPLPPLFAPCLRSLCVGSALFVCVCVDATALALVVGTHKRAF